MKRRRGRAEVATPAAPIPNTGGRLLRYALVPLAGLVGLTLLAIRHAGGAGSEPEPPPTLSAAEIEEAFDAYEQATLAGDDETQTASAGRIRAAGPAASDTLGRRLAGAAGSPGLTERYIGLASEMGAVDVLAKEYRARPPTDTATRELFVGGISTSSSSQSIPTLESLYRYESSPELRSSIEGGLAAAGATPSRIAALRREPSVAERTIERNLELQASVAESRGDTVTAEALRRAQAKENR